MTYVKFLSSIAHSDTLLSAYVNPEFIQIADLRSNNKRPSNQFVKHSCDKS